MRDYVIQNITGGGMREYIIRIPITGFVGTCIYAKNEKDAVKKGMGLEYQLTDIEEWCVRDIIVKDGVFKGIQNTIKIEEI